jgi:DNA-damage-inducible protein J
MNARTPIKSTDLRLRVEPELKQSAAEVLAECGLTFSDAIRLFLRQVVVTHGLPFAVRIPNAETTEAMKEARSIAAAHFGTAQDLFNDLEKNSRPKTRKTSAKK